MRPRSKFFYPPTHLSGCIFGAIFRDTRHTILTDAQRFNHFPASPLFSATFIIEGDLRLMTTKGGTSNAKPSISLPKFSVMPPNDGPISSWSPGPVAVLSVGFYPEAWAKLEQNGALDVVSAALSKAFPGVPPENPIDPNWSEFCNALSPIWQDTRTIGGLSDWSGTTRLSDWSRSILSRVALAGAGRSIRSLERGLKRWSTQSRQSLKFYSDMENLHRISVVNSDVDLAGMASDAGYSDQSHMGRAVRRATGFSPAQLNKKIETDEAFWCYRLLGERF